jgi:tetratricopeptide (TPR) repeat protein
MKIRILIILSVFLGGMSLQAQDAKDLLKTAGKALSAYNLDPSGNGEKLAEAKKAIDQAFDMEDLSADFKANLTKAQVNTELVANDYKMVLLKPDAEPKNVNAGGQALDAIKMGLKSAEKKYELKEILSVLGELAPYLSVIGNQYIGLQKYAEAYVPLAAVLTANQLLKENDEKSIFENDDDLGNHKYVTAVCAMRAEKVDVAENLLMELYNSGSKEAGVYSQLYALKADTDEDMAMKILAKGQEIDPGNTELLFAEINYYIKKEKFDVLEQKLKMAIEKDPENPSVYSALGNVYMNLSDKAMKENDEEARQQYFDNAMSYYKQTIELDDQSFDAYYSIGSLYFNQAAEKTKQMQNLGLSKEDQVKYTTLEAETAELFEQALPYFKSAEKLDPSDMNTLIALKEIFARQDEFEKSKEFKTRLETVQSGGKIEKSYFE